MDEKDKYTEQKARIQNILEDVKISLDDISTELTVLVERIEALEKREKC